MKVDPILATILAGLATSCGTPTTQGTGCMAVDANATTCPHADEIPLEALSLPGNCDEQVVGKRGAGTLTPLTGQDGTSYSACCYDVDKIDPDPNVYCVVGRPFKEAGLSRAAAFRLQGPVVAKAWARAAEGEHASVASFARLSLQLMAWGAPLELLSDAHEAALDEVRHADACIDMAKRYGATDVSIGRFPFTQPVAVGVSLAEIAVDALLEGCINETLGAYAAREAARRSSDPEVQKTLDVLANDETRHAALAYRIVKWALTVGGSEVREAVVEALARPLPHFDTDELATRTGVPAQDLSDLHSEGLRRVVEPALGALLAA